MAFDSTTNMQGLTDSAAILQCQNNFAAIAELNPDTNNPKYLGNIISSPATGYIGQMISDNGINVATNTSGLTNIQSITLTPGVWLVSAGGQLDNIATQTGGSIYLFVKSVNSATLGMDFIFEEYSAGKGQSYCFIPRVVVIAAADPDKTIVVKAQSETAAGSCWAFITAVRIA